MNRKSLFWGALLVILGALLLLDNLDLLPFEVWDVFWPSVLILLGVRILWRQFFIKRIQGEHFELPLENFQQAQVRLKHGAGKLVLNSTAPLGILLTGDFGGGVEVQKHVTGVGIDVELSMPSQGFPSFLEPGSLDWSLQVSSQVSLSLLIDTGASDSLLDMRDLKIKEFTIKSGASSMEVRLPAQAGDTHGRFESGAASLSIHIPEGVAAQIRSRGGLSSLRLDEQRFPRRGDVYESTEYPTATNRVSLDIQMGVGSVEIR